MSDHGIMIGRSLCRNFAHHCPASLKGENKVAKVQFSSVQICYCKGNGSVHERAIWLESLISNRICSRDPGKHILEKAVLGRHWRWTIRLQSYLQLRWRQVFQLWWSVSSVLGLSLHSLQVFYTFYKLFELKYKPLQLTQAVAQMSTKAKPRGRAPPLLCICLPLSPMQLLWETIQIRLYQHVTPPSLEASPPPSHHLGFSRRAKKVHGTELLYTLYMIVF
jgi:hypothetical protein